jgi:hypothetical protein
LSSKGFYHRVILKVSGSCGRLWADRSHDDVGVHHEWTRRADVLIPPGTEAAAFSASRLFAAVYPEAARLASPTASPTWRHLAAGDADQHRQFTTEVGRRLDCPHDHPAGSVDVVAHWMMFDFWRPPSEPSRTFPDTRHHGAIHQPKVSENSRDRHNRSAHWFARNRRGGGAILHHRHIRPVLIREWSPKIDGIAGSIWASQTTIRPWRRDNFYRRGPLLTCSEAPTDTHVAGNGLSWLAV